MKEEQLRTLERRLFANALKVALMLDLGQTACVHWRIDAKQTAALVPGLADDEFGRITWIAMRRTTIGTFELSRLSYLRLLDQLAHEMNVRT